MKRLATLRSARLPFALKVKGTSLAVKNIEQVISLMAYPSISILEQRGDGYVLTLPASLAARRFHAFANTLSTGLLPRTDS